MRATLHAAAAALALALLAGPVPSAAAKEDWPTIRNEMETVEFQAPPGFREVPLTNPNFVKHVEYDGEPYGKIVIRVAAYKQQTDLDHFLNFIKTDIGGTSATPDPEKKGRMLITQTDPSGNEFDCLVQALTDDPKSTAKDKWGYYIKIVLKKEKYEADKDTWDRVLDSFKIFTAPPDAFAVPKDWKCIRNEMFAVMAPVNTIKDRKERDRLEVRMGQVSSWLGIETDQVRMLRDITGDERKFIPKMPVHILPTAEAFRAEAGDAWVEGDRAVYLAGNPERVVVVNGATDSGLREQDLVGTAGVQYLESRIGKLWPWIRAGFRRYLVAGYDRKCNPGLFPPELLKRAKEVFAKSPPTLEELMKKDEKGIRDLGEDGAVACWGLLQFGLHGADAPTRSLFRRLLNRDFTEGKTLDEAWEKSQASYKEEAKRTFRPRDVDNGARKYIREMKEEKEKK